MTEEEEFEFRARLEAEQAQAPKEKPKGWADSLNPTLRKTLEIGIPTALAVGGELAAAPFTGGMTLPMAAATVMTAGGIGGLGGESIKQAIGLTEPNAEDLGYAMLGGPIGRAIGGVVQGGIKMIPGIGDSLRASFSQEAKNLPENWLKTVLGGKTAKDLYSELGKKDLSHRIQTFPNVEETVKKLRFDSENVPWDEMRTALKADGSEKLFDQIMGSIRGTKPTTRFVEPTISGKQGGIKTGLPKTPITEPGKEAGLPFNEVDAAMKGFGRLIGRTEDNVKRGEYQQLYKAFLSDIEKAPMPSNGPIDAWKAARKAAKLEIATTDLAKAVERSITEKDGIPVLNPNQVLKWMRTNEEFKSRLTGEEFRQLHNQFRLMASVSGHNMSKFTAMIVGGFASGGAGGALAGYLGAEQLSRTMMTEPGQKLVRSMFTDPTKSNFRRAFTGMGSAVGAAMRSPAQEDEE